MAQHQWRSWLASAPVLRELSCRMSTRTPWRWLLSGAPSWPLGHEGTRHPARPSQRQRRRGEVSIEHSRWRGPADRARHRRRLGPAPVVVDRRRLRLPRQQQYRPSHLTHITKGWGWGGRGSGYRDSSSAARASQHGAH